MSAPDNIGRLDPFESLRNAIVVHPRDWAADYRDAWIYGVIVGWGDALPEVAALHDWSDAAVVRLRTLRAAFELVEQSARLDWSMMARAIERAGLPATMIRTPDGAINNCAINAGYDERDCQVCGGAYPDKARYER